MNYLWLFGSSLSGNPFPFDMVLWFVLCGSHFMALRHRHCCFGYTCKKTVPFDRKTWTFDRLHSHNLKLLFSVACIGFVKLLNLPFGIIRNVILFADIRLNFNFIHSHHSWTVSVATGTGVGLFWLPVVGCLPDSRHRFIVCRRNLINNEKKLKKYRDNVENNDMERVLLCISICTNSSQWK